MAHAAGRTVWRVGHSPDPWAWTPWQYAHAGRFGGRWDDPDGRWRTQYAGHSTLACYLEVLAVFQPDPTLAAELDAITEDPAAATASPPAGPARCRAASCRCYSEAPLALRCWRSSATTSAVRDGAPRRSACRSSQKT